MSYKIANNIVLSLILILGFYLSFMVGMDREIHFNDWNFFGFQGGKFMTSRFTGYPVEVYYWFFFLLLLKFFII